MLEIQPVLLSPSIVKPRKIDRDDNPAQKQPRKKPQDAEKQNEESTQHIDETV